MHAKIIKQEVLGYSEDLKTTYIRNEWDNGDVTYHQHEEIDGLRYGTEHTTIQPYVARPLSSIREAK